MKTILGFGASTMQGVGDPQGGFFSRLPEHPRLALLPLRFRNHGIGGNTLSDMLNRAAAATAEKPYDLIVILGCNDLPRRPDVQPEKRSALPDYTARVGSLLRQIQGENSLFITSFCVSPAQTGILPGNLKDYMSAALSIASDLGYETWDLHRESAKTAPSLWAPDGLHFGPEGHAMIAGRVAEWIASKASILSECKDPALLQGSVPGTSTA